MVVGGIKSRLISSELRKQCGATLHQDEEGGTGHGAPAGRGSGARRGCSGERRKPTLQQVCEPAWHSSRTRKCFCHQARSQRWRWGESSRPAAREYEVGIGEEVPARKR